MLRYKEISRKRVNVTTKQDERSLTWMKLSPRVVQKLGRCDLGASQVSEIRAGSWRGRFSCRFQTLTLCLPGAGSRQPNKDSGERENKQLREDDEVETVKHKCTSAQKKGKTSLLGLVRGEIPEQAAAGSAGHRQFPEAGSSNSETTSPKMRS
ncbi:coiled-coil domain-containing protein 12 isoform X3 [Tyto alba]|uniref:coiled-coil domain-containing protein 12 isoform X3 n=1 Tax=Tyto alba TaxID=56313 RepID=UPI001C66CBE8|nr:coiled-coil domain-containing protein 12 isoform X3 [Tyto alba]